MLFLLALAFIASSTLVSNVTATSQSNTVQSHDKDINKRSDGLMHELVNLLVDEKFHRKETKNMTDKMVQQNEKILKKLAGFSKKLESYERKIWKESTKVKKITSELKTLKKEVVSKLDNTRNLIQGIQNNFGNFKQEMKNTTGLLSQQLKSKGNEILNLKTAINIKNGAVYIRWGGTRCPSADTKLVYSGYAGGAYYTQNAGTNTQCLPKNPNWRRYHDGRNNFAAHMHGAEYETHVYSVGEVLHKNYHNYDVPCAVCQSTKRLNVHMIPAKDRCNNGWHLEYRGYLMSQKYTQGASNYVCFDARPERIGSKVDKDGRLFYPVESICGSLPCPPYVDGRELTCAVCTF